MADQRIQYNEAMTGANHPTKTDTLNRLTLIEHDTEGNHTKGLSGNWTDLRKYSPDLTGGTEATTAIQNALDEIASVGGSVFCPPGTLLHDQLIFPSHVRLFAPQKGLTIFKGKPEAAGSLFYANDETDIRIKNIVLNGNAAAQTGSIIGVDFQDCDNIFLDDFEVFDNSGSYEIRIQSITKAISRIRLSRGNIYRTGADTGDGSFLFIAGLDASPFHTAGNVVLDDIDIHADSTSALKDGIELVGVLDVFASRVYAKNMGGYGISADVENAGFFKLLACICNSNALSGIGLNGSPSTSVPNSCLILGCTTISNTQNGIMNSSIPGAIIAAHNSRLNGWRGAEINTAGAIGTQILGGKFLDNGSGLTGTNAAGIYVGAYADGVSIIGVRSKNKDTSHQQYGFTLSPTVAGTVVSANDFLGNAVAECSLGSPLAKSDIIMTSVSGAPGFIGQIAISGGNAYIAVGTSSAADWKQITN